MCCPWALTCFRLSFSRRESERDKQSPTRHNHTQKRENSIIPDAVLSFLSLFSSTFPAGKTGHFKLHKGITRLVQGAARGCPRTLICFYLSFFLPGKERKGAESHAAQPHTKKREWHRFRCAQAAALFDFICLSPGRSRESSTALQRPPQKAAPPCTASSFPSPPLPFLP